ncbi:uncharacterized protein TNCV_1284721 [Trichonephila clavipes]|uniref:DUF4371 domain-containing protein n=1 Tax=Trichonephila clavipes TaxID=2585209 RepID=A0A8X6SL83_TRICX|nr:uncharacterized protein TNCV_1284721 [Trichonephila clavipes]
MCSNITTQHIEDLKLVSALPIAVDESCDINDTAQVTLFVRFMSHSGPKEELLGLLPLKGQTRGKGIANAVIECMDKHHIPLDKIVSILTDGAKKALCAQTFTEEIRKVMELVIIIINPILAKALHHHQFKEFLFEMESEVKYTGRVYKLQAGFLQADRKLAQCTHRTRLKAAFKKLLKKLTLPATLHATRRLLSDLDCKGSSTRGEFTSYKPAILQAARKLAQCTHRTRLKAAFKKALEKN